MILSDERLVSLIEDAHSITIEHQANFIDDIIETDIMKYMTFYLQEEPTSTAIEKVVFTH